MQGATCYLNSLLQTLFAIRSFRRAVYHMPTEEAEEPSASISVALKYLLFRMQYQQSPVSAKELIASFGWGSADAFQQHDVQELELILYDKLEEKMKGTLAVLTVAVWSCTSQLVQAVPCNSTRSFTLAGHACVRHGTAHMLKAPQAHEVNIAQQGQSPYSTLACTSGCQSCC